MTDLVIHIGTHKTGSTAIQHALRKCHYTCAAKEGWRLLRVPGEVISPIMTSTAYSHLYVSRLKASIDNEVNKKPSLCHVLSSEGLSGSPVHGYTNSRLVAAMLHEATHDLNVQIVVYLRKQDDWAESMYTQMVHEGKSLEFSEFLNGITSKNALNYRALVDDFASYFGGENICVRSYHNALKKGILNDFSEIIGSRSLAAYGQDTRNNPSYSQNAVKIAKHLNPRLNKKQKRRLRGILQKRLPKPPQSAFYYFTNDERNRFVSRFELCNKELAKKYFGDDVYRLFPYANGSPDFQERDTVEVQQVAEIVGDVIALNSHSGIIKYLAKKLNRFPRFKAAIRIAVKRTDG